MTTWTQYRVRCLTFHVSVETMCPAVCFSSAGQARTTEKDQTSPLERKGRGILPSAALIPFPCRKKTSDVAHTRGRDVLGRRRKSDSLTCPCRRPCARLFHGDLLLLRWPRTGLLWYARKMLGLHEYEMCSLFVVSRSIPVISRIRTAKGCADNNANGTAGMPLIPYVATLLHCHANSSVRRTPDMHPPLLFDFPCFLVLFVSFLFDFFVFCLSQLTEFHHGSRGPRL